MSARTAEYLRIMLTPRDGRTPVDPSPSIAALSPTACHLWEVLSNLAWHTDNAALESVAELARRMHRDRSTVQRARAELVRAGVIAVAEGGGRANANRYRFPLGAPVEAVHNGGTGAALSESTTAAPVHERAAPVRHSFPTDPPSTERDAIDRGAVAAGESLDTLAGRMRAVIEQAAAEERRRIGDALYRRAVPDE